MNVAVQVGAAGGRDKGGAWQERAETNLHPPGELWRGAGSQHSRAVELAWAGGRIGDRRSGCEGVERPRSAKHWEIESADRAGGEGRRICGPYMGPQRQCLVGQRAQGHIDWGALRWPGSNHTGPASWGNISSVKVLSRPPQDSRAMGDKENRRLPRLASLQPQGLGRELRPWAAGCAQVPPWGVGPWEN